MAMADAIAQEHGQCLRCPVSTRVGSVRDSEKLRIQTLQVFLLHCILLCWLNILVCPTEASVGFRFKGWDRRFAKCNLVRIDGGKVDDVPEFEALVMVNSANEVVSFEPAKAVPMCDLSNSNLAFVPCGDTAVRQDHTRFVFPLPDAGKVPLQKGEDEQKEEGEWRIAKIARTAGSMAWKAASSTVAAGGAVVNYMMGRSAPPAESLQQKLITYHQKGISYSLECMDPVSETTMRSTLNPPLASIIGQGFAAVLELENSDVNMHSGGPYPERV
ncbi:putative transmembrane protein [Toxoplasma gondii GAB2-2007-GAL-DOM2]|uniref:Putative transmembrane protein n=6 Tax=Toxoplasma gondii TaxID=5811 RepID=A0A086QGJ2_TOXGO|nr:putative transmembrane protein [Toxoplasma gondii GAB2-2007-GAL-DOM2]KFG45675.1 putative transmembrane protein [Toxoplasma gondii p89]KFG53622.1 putative transmembrane protein [Toxoplasma gondii FOU]KFH07026.1 putative transmembrane protein [Toxoplasma gondii VAND]KFH11724.1 putative transmembrane protein [Toxoplasma gondii MAS]PUA89506.1 putative transmembrane protein [Toxoplasma gondii TgCATBr9]